MIGRYLAERYVELAQARVKRNTSLTLAQALWNILPEELQTKLRAGDNDFSTYADSSEAVKLFYSKVSVNEQEHVESPLNTRIKPIVWTEELQANTECKYNHVIGHTPIGNYVITWKEWKENDSPTIDETPWGSYGGFGPDVESTKKVAEAEYYSKIMSCLG